MIGIIVYVTGAILGTIIWGVRLEGRVNTADLLSVQKHLDLKELIESKFEAIDQRLARIEHSMNGRSKE